MVKFTDKELSIAKDFVCPKCLSLHTSISEPTCIAGERDVLFVSGDCADCHAMWDITYHLKDGYYRGAK